MKRRCAFHFHIVFLVKIFHFHLDCPINFLKEISNVIQLNGHRMRQLDFYLAFCLDIARDRMNGASNETRTHS